MLTNFSLSKYKADRILKPVEITTITDRHGKGRLI